MSEWNPFGDDNFGAYTEDILFGKEFDKLRRGSNSSKSGWDFFFFFLIFSSGNIGLNMCVFGFTGVPICQDGC